MAFSKTLSAFVWLFATACFSQSESRETPDNATRIDYGTARAQCPSMELKIRELLRTAARCTEGESCVAVPIGCPFGCGSVIRNSQALELKPLLLRFKSECSVCAYDCNFPAGAGKCVNGTCDRAVIDTTYNNGLGALDPKECKTEEKRIRLEAHKARSCNESSDCAESPLWCPFGCAGLINKAEGPRMQALYQRYATSCRACEYKCAVTSGKPYCLNKKCVWKE